MVDTKDSGHLCILRGHSVSNHSPGPRNMTHYNTKRGIKPTLESSVLDKEIFVTDNVECSKTLLVYLISEKFFVRSLRSPFLLVDEYMFYYCVVVTCSYSRKRHSSHEISTAVHDNHRLFIDKKKKKKFKL